MQIQQDKNSEPNLSGIRLYLQNEFTFGHQYFAIPEHSEFRVGFILAFIKHKIGAVTFDSLIDSVLSNIKA